MKVSQMQIPNSFQSSFAKISNQRGNYEGEPKNIKKKTKNNISKKN